MHQLCKAFFALLFLSALVTASAAPATLWTPMTAEEAAMTDSAIEPGAHAEIILYEAKIDHEDGNDAKFDHHTRVKILTEKGAQDFLSQKFYYSNDSSISKIETRIYRPDGTTVTLTDKDALDQEIVRQNRLKVRAKVITLPGLVPGCVIESRWFERFKKSNFLSFAFQGDYPTRLVSCNLNSYDSLFSQPFLLNYKGPLPRRNRETNRYLLRMESLKSRKDEPYEPPATHIHPHLYIFNTPGGSSDAYRLWRAYSEYLYTERTKLAKTRGDLTKTAASLIAGATTEEQKLARIYEFCVTKIKNKNLGYAGYTEHARSQLKTNRTATDTFKNGYGTREDINQLFVALASHAGIDAQLALACSREFIEPSFNRADACLFNDMIVALPQKGGGWIYLDPGSIFLPYGFLRPENEGAKVVIGHATRSKTSETHQSDPALSLKKRTARFSLDEEGTLSGTVTIDYTGMRAYEMKYLLEDQTTEQQQDIIKAEVTATLPLAELTDIQVEGARSPTLPLKITYQLRIPQYADRTGSRLLLQPAVFQKGDAPYFTAETRENDISFRRNQTTEDDLRIDLPPGFILEEGSAPITPSLKGLGDYRVEIRSSKKGSFLLYKRIFSTSAVTLKAEAYPRAKSIFERLHAADTHVLSLKENAPL